MDRPKVTGLCALHTRLAEMEGVEFTKKRKRYSDMADYVLWYMKPSKEFYVELELLFGEGEAEVWVREEIMSSIWEAVMAASEDHIEGTGYKDLKEMNKAYEWIL